MTCKEKILSNDYFDFVTDYFMKEDRYGGELDFCSIPIQNQYVISYVNRQQLPPISVSKYGYLRVPKLYGLMDTKLDTLALNSAGITEVQREPLHLTGEGVVIGFVDTGIRYTDAIFLDETRKSRILAIWDQNIQEGKAPEGLEYGTEYRNEEINEALKLQNPRELVPSWDDNGHGTALASIAAGGKAEGSEFFVGAAPKSQIVVVKLKKCKQYLREYYFVKDDIEAYEETDIMLGIAYLEKFAKVLDRPLVICLGIGTNYGDHGGSSALARYISIVANKRNRGVVVCGGNEGNKAHHYQGNISYTQGVKEKGREIVELRVGEGQSGFMVELWGNPPDIFKASIRSPGGEVIPKFSLNLNQSITYRFIYEETEITVDSLIVEEESGRELIVFRFKKPTPGIWTFIVESIYKTYNGIFHMWLPITDFLESETYFLKPNPYVTITEPGMSKDVITLATYEDLNQSLYIASGRGFSVDEMIKPDLAAPGVGISTILGQYTGSSMAAALTAGAVAQFMQWAVVEGRAPFVGTREIKNYLIRGARRENEISYPNSEWGYGKLDLKGTFDSMIGI